MLDGDPAPPKKENKKRGVPLNFRPMSIVAKRSPISATAELLFDFQLAIASVCSVIASDTVFDPWGEFSGRSSLMKT